jgi:hypothetical protein
MATMLDELPQLIDLVKNYPDNKDLVGAHNMIEYVRKNRVLMRNEVGRGMFLDQMRDELAQLYDAADMASSVTSVAGAVDPSDAASNAGAADLSDAASNADAKAEIEARLIADFVTNHKGKVVQIADDSTWERLSKFNEPQAASSGTGVIVFGQQDGPATVFFQKPDDGTPLGKTMRYVQESQRFRGELPTYKKYVEEFVRGNDKENDEFLSDFKFPQYASLTHDDEKIIQKGPVFVDMPPDLEYVTIFPFDKDAYDLVKQYQEEFHYTPDIIARASFKTRKDDVPPNKLALDYLLGIADDRSFTDFEFYDS